MLDSYITMHAAVHSIWSLYGQQKQPVAIVGRWTTEYHILMTQSLDYQLIDLQSHPEDQ